ncbi:MAG: peptidoglycan DD-metalloendopeptidase family protein [Clostridia bacterium]|nr:peptidoglycan DD-metalloendopeptidase family protein [Clostridia bacterium]
MKKKHLLSFFLTVLCIGIILSLSVLSSSATTYNYLFPVNNGGSIAYLYGYTDAYGAWHDGIDIHASGDDTIYAAYSGTVGATADSCTHVSCGYQCEHWTTYGNYIRIDQDDGTSAYYGHLLKGSLKVSVGSRVVAGQAIATMGSSGYSTGKHLHFEVRSGSSKINVNPTSKGGSINYSYSGYGNNASSISYANISEGTYYIKNNSTGEYVSVSEGKDFQGNQVNTWEFVSSSEFQMKLTKASSGYRMRPGCCSSRLVNAYGDTVQSGSNVNIWDDWNESSQWWGFEKVSGGYVIRNMMNPSCVLSLASDGRKMIVSTYTGATSQKWTLQNLVKYNANGGSGAPKQQLKNYGSSLTLSSTKPTRSGYVFLGWSTSSSATSATYKAGGSYTANKNVTLYAVWHKHTAGAAATCTTAQKCTTCGETLVAAKGHKAGAAATCTTAQKCTVCSATLVAAKGHKAGAAATCTTAQKCTVCSATLVAAKGHKAGAAATCTTAQKCTVCSVVLTPAKGHKLGPAATCTTPQTCTTCGTTISPVGGHHPGPEATCTSPQTCTTCGKTLAEKKAHTPGSAATCTEPQTCSKCGTTLAKEIGHKPGAAATCTEPQKCTVCEATLAEAVGHKAGTPATCTEPQKCTVCSSVLSDAKGHRGGAAATCTTPQKCTTCGVTLAEALGHVAEGTASCTEAQKCATCAIIITQAKGHTLGEAATCTEPQKCTTCGIIVNPVGGHHPGAAATCTAPQTCITCGITIAEKEAHTPGAAATCTTSQNCLVCGTVLAQPTAHTPGDWISDADGSSEVRCIDCDTRLDYRTPETTSKDESTEEIPEYSTKPNDSEEKQEEGSDNSLLVLAGAIVLSAAAIVGTILFVVKKRK